MCWSAEASLTITAVGFTGAVVEYIKAVKKDASGQSQFDREGYLSKSMIRAFTLFYFSLMELLQTFNYFYLSELGPYNSLLSFLGYVHISFQPIPSILFLFSFLPLARRGYWIKIGVSLAAIASILMLSRLIINPSLPSCFSTPCAIKTTMDTLLDGGRVGCSPDLTFMSYRGDWHIAWRWALNDCEFAGAYFVISLILPLLAGCYRIVLFTTLMGPVLSWNLTSNPDEWAAIWCLLSIAFLSSIKIPALERFMTVKEKSIKKSEKAGSLSEEGVKHEVSTPRH